MKNTGGTRNTDLNVMDWQLELMSLLPSGVTEMGLTAKELAREVLKDPQRSCSSEHEDSLVHKIQNHMKRLAQHKKWGPMLVCRIEKNGKLIELKIQDGESAPQTMYWKWAAAPGMIIPPPDENACLSLLMIEKRLKDELPPATQDYLNPFIAKARERIEALSTFHRLKKWQRKIVNQSPTQLLTPTHPRKNVQDLVLRALYDDCPLQFSYMKRHQDQYQTYQVMPLGVVMRGPVTYLIAFKLDASDDQKDIPEQMFALNRMSKAELLDRKAPVSKKASFERYLKRGGSDFVIGGLADGQTIRLEADVAGNVAQRLDETPLAENQTLTDIQGGLFRLTAELPITMQLGWWLLGFGPKVKVISPPKLRNWIAAQHCKAAELYRN